MEALTAFFSAINGFVWGPPMLVLILGTGLLLQIRLKLMPILRIPTGFRMVWRGRQPDADGRGRDQPLRRADDRARRHRRYRQHRRRRHRDRARRAGRAVLDVDDGAGRHGDQVFRGAARRALPRGRRPRRARAAGRCSRSRTGSGRSWRWLGAAFALFGGLAGFGIGNMVQSNSIAEVVNASFGDPALDHRRRAHGADRLRAARRHQAHRRGGREARARDVHRLHHRRADRARTLRRADPGGLRPDLRRSLQPGRRPPAASSARPS